jgi:hypothetical protein
MFKRENFNSRAIKIEMDNLTSGSNRPQKKTTQSNLSIQEISDGNVTLSLNSSVSLCASGHHLKIDIIITEAEAKVHFAATGVAREVSKEENGFRIVFQPVQFDKAEWTRLLEAFDAASKKIEKIFDNLKG